MDKSKLKWMGKLAKTRSFILMTDTEAVVNIRQVSKEKGSFKDTMLMASYKAELEMFKEKINDAIKQVDAQMGTKKPAKKGRKITVK